ncbi:hypothetical protein DV495_003620 [Geotrichum candidum]|nr:hypothetical protein DV454_001446 [Geotrichum candidum]KAF5124943.1 hypothetical protein DV495_003620 [Geotrichum candidum]KAF7498709.1 hypothetical protein DV113_003241 [Geotrichum candidum]KAI8133725.1 hypothetical protein DUD61_002596 [Geotrichum candidum]
MLRALFQAPDPGPLLRKIRISLRDSSRFLLIVPPAKLMWAYEADTKQPFADAFLTDEFIASHVVFIPSDYRSSDKSKLMSTYNAKKIILARGFVQTHSGFKSSYHSDIVAEYIIRPGAPFLADDAEFLCCEVTYPLMGTPVFYDLLDQSTDSTKQILFDGNILDTPVPLGLDVATLKDNVNKLRDFKLLPVIYGQELSRLDYEFTLLVNQFNCDHVSTKEHLLRLYNDTIDTAIAKFQALGSNTINRIASETMLSGLDLANMIGMHIESQLHSLLWEKTLELCQEEDTRRLDNCWKVKDISIEQDIRRDSIIERCRRKLENARESQMEQQPQQLIFTSADSMAVEVFFDHAQQEIGQLSRASHNLHRAVVRLACKVDDYNTSFRILSDMVAKLKLIRGNAIPRYGRIEQKLAVLAAVQPPDAYHEFASSLYSVCAMVDDVMKTIRSPLAAISQLRDRETILISSRETLERVTSKSGPSWTNVFFEEKKRKETEELRDRIYIVQTEIDRISTDIRGQHVTLASEIGAVYGTHEQLMAQMVKVFTSKIIRSQRVSLERLERMKAGLQSVGRRRRVPAEKYSLA